MGNRNHAYNSEGISRLLARTLRGGLARPDYFRGPCGRYLSEILGIDPEYMFRMGVRGTRREGEPYVPLNICLTHDEIERENRGRRRR